jgi:hypothetical protein
LWWLVRHNVVDAVMNLVKVLRLEVCNDTRNKATGMIRLDGAVIDSLYTQAHTGLIAYFDAMRSNEAPVWIAGHELRVNRFEPIA